MLIVNRLESATATSAKLTTREGPVMGLAATSRPVSEAQVAAATQFWQARGMQVRPAPNLSKKNGVFAGTDDERIMGFRDLIEDQSVAYIHFMRGGYGTTRILPQLVQILSRARPLVLIGHSDLTPLLNACIAYGHIAIHGPLGCQVPTGQQVNEDWERLLAFITTGSLPSVRFCSTNPENGADITAVNRAGKAKGQIIGGNLSLIINTLGTPNCLDFKGKILMIEEVDEYKYRIDRMLVQLLQAGVFNTLSGLVVGSFAPVLDNPEAFGEGVVNMVNRCCRGLEFPLCFGYPAGHGTRNFPTLLGKQVELTVCEDHARLIYC